MNEIEMLKMEVQELRAIINKIVGQEKYIFPSHIQILDGRKIQLGKTTGTQLGTETDQKVAFLGKTPISRQSSISSPIADVDSLKTAVDLIITRLEDFGFIAPN